MTKIRPTDIQAVRKFRTDEMRERRRLHGDKGERFSGRLWRPSTDGICNTITSVLKDFYIIEIYNGNKTENRTPARVAGKEVQDKETNTD